MSNAIIRPSIGTAMLLNLRKGDLPNPPTTAYLMIGDECSNNCGFCTQAREASGSGEMLSRVSWPSFGKEEVINALARSKEMGIGRVCLQCLNDPAMVKDLPSLIGEISKSSGLPISVSISSMAPEYLASLREAGADRVGIAVDAGSKELFDRIKGKGVGNPYDWDDIWRSMEDAVQIFGWGKVSTHLIIGMGESDRNVFDVMKRSRDTGVLLSLFAYTPMEGTDLKLDPPPLVRYRAMQFMRHCVIASGSTFGFEFDDGRLTGIPSVLDDAPGSAFMTRGCPNCNRPYYNERPRGPMYNYPRELTRKEHEDALEMVREYIIENNIN
ncbi:MAG: radical SAM protein [Candidatus Thermoplasmatota archaeon]|nr:radical SAM protein [Candidatus Thermoplasmatota archaeon]